MADIVRWGVLSTAKIGVAKVIPAMQRGTVSRVVAIASRDGAAARAAADQLGIERAHGSYEALIDDPEVDAIYNPLPNHLHVAWTVRALEAGKHVLCEKPIARDAEEARSLIAARDRTGRLVAEAFMVRHTPWWRRARDLATDGTIGTARAVQTFFSFHNVDPANIRNQADMGGGGLLDIGCYAINTARFVFGAEPERVAALIDRDPVMQVDRMTSALIAFPGDRHLTFTCSTQLAPFQRVTVVGTTARVEVPIPFNAPPDASLRVLVDDGRDLSGAGARVETFEPADQYTLQGDAFSRAVLGQEPWPYPIEDAIANMRVIDAVFRAGASGAWERV